MRFAFLLSLLAISAQSAPIGAPLTIEKLIAHLEAHPEIRSIDALLPDLPEDFRRNFTLMHHSNSLQGATPEQPRAILFGPDARFVIAFNSDPKDSHFDSLETIQFRDEKKAFEFREIKFPENNASKQVEISAANPPLCLTCHFKDPRPNWEHYSSWPGAFGEDDDEHRYSGNPALLKRITDFLKVAEKQPRFRHIPNLADSYEREEADRFRTKYEHNIKFTQRIAQLNFLRVTRLMQESKYYDKFKYAALGAAGCDTLSRFLTDYVRKEFAPEIENGTFRGGAAAMPSFFKALGRQGTDSWSMDFQAKEPQFTTPGNNHAEFLAHLAQSDADLKPFVSIEESTYQEIPWKRGSIDYRDGCRRLAERSLSALETLEDSEHR